MSTTFYNQGRSGYYQNPSYNGPEKLIHEPSEVCRHFQKYSLVIMGILLVLFILSGVCFYLVYDYSNKFYETVSSGQDSLCNFYTCSGEGDCAHYPKITLPDGSMVCAPR